MVIKCFRPYIKIKTYCVLNLKFVSKTSFKTDQNFHTRASRDTFKQLVSVGRWREKCIQI